MPTKLMSKSELIKWAAAIILAAIIMLIPTSGLFTAQVRVFIAVTVFCIALLATEVLPVAVIAALMPTLWLFTGVADFSIIMSPFLGTTIYMIMGGFLLAAMLEQCGILQRVAYWIMIRVSGSYTKLLYGVWIAGVAVMQLTFGSGYLIVFVLGIGIVKALGVLNTRSAVGIGFATLLGGCTAKSFIYSASNYSMIMGMSGGLMNINDYPFNPLTVIFHNCPMFLVSAIMLFVISKWYKPEKELGGKEYFIEQYVALGPMKREEKWNIFLFFALVLFMVTNTIHHLPTDYGFMIIPWLGFLPFIKTADTNTLKNVQFEMLFFAVACMSIGTVAASLGLNQAIAAVVGGLLGDNGNIFIFAAACFIVMFLLNFLLTPMAIWALASAPIIQTAINLGYDPTAFVYLLISGVEAIIFPYEYVPYLLFYTFGFMSMKDFVKVNAARSIMFFIGIMVLLIPWWIFIGLV